jgi:hypothetical protein
MSKIDFNVDGIGHFISDNFLKVPIYQRPYAWNEEHIIDLINDLKESFPEEYFLGTIVVSRKNGFLEIIDGQQRLATFTIIYSAIRNFLLELKDDEGAKIIEEEYIYKPLFRTREPEVKLELGFNDKEFFKNQIILRTNGKTIQKEKLSHERIAKAYSKLYNYIKNEYSSHSNQLNHINDLIDFFKENIKIIIVSVADEANAFTIFETLNDRGLSLSQVDLIKNFLFNKAGNRLSEAQDKWSRFTGAIEAAENEQEILQYIRYHWSSKYGLTREKELFDSIKRKTNNSNLVITYLAELESDVNSYLALLNPNHNFWNSYSDSCRIFLKNLLELQLFQNRPLLLSILKRFAKADVEKAFKLIVSWSVRNLITGVVGSGTIEKEFSQQAKLINEGSIKKANELKQSVINLIPTDEAFKRQFKIATVSKNYIARYYLSELEKTYHKTKEQETSKDTEKVNLEHILPEKPDLKKDWNNFTEDEHKTFYKRIGNLTLLDKDLNSKQKSSAFSEKKKFYKSSEILISKSLSNIKNWDKKAIEKRQEEFSEKAVETWSLKI